MTRRALGRAAVALLLAVPFSTTTFHAQQAQPNHTLTFAELTHGTSINALVAAPGGGAWFGGRTCSLALPTSTNAVQRTKSSGCHGMLGKVMPNGAIAYLSYLGGSQGNDSVTALTVDSAGNLYAAGSTLAPDFPVTSDAYDTTCGDDGTCYTYKNVQGNYLNVPASDAFITKLAPAGDRILYSTYFGGSDDESIGTIAVDASGRVHIAGSTLSRNLPVTANALQTAYVGGADPDGNPWRDAFYARFAAGGASLQYGTYLGGSGDEAATMALDSSGNAYVAGSTTGGDFPVLNAVQPANASAPGYSLTSDGWLARFGDTAVYSTYVGGSGDDYVTGVAAVGGDVYLAGMTCSSDFPGASDTTTECRAFIAEAASATGAVGRTMTLHAAGGRDTANNVAVDANHEVYVTGVTTASAYPTTTDAYQRTYAGSGDAFLSIVDFSGETPSLAYSTYLGGSQEEHLAALALDGTGGAYFAGYLHWLNTRDFPAYPSAPPPAAETAGYQSFAAHVAAVNRGAGGSEIILYARDAAAVAGAWQPVSDSTAAGGTRLWLPDAGAPKLSSASATPANYFDLTFAAPAGVPYQLWLRMKADADSWQNDSVFVQFSDALDPQGSPRWRIGTTDATVVSLEDCSGCGEHAWGWNDNGYDTTGVMVTFATGGTHTLRIQQREDGISIDQVVLSSAAYVTAAPGANKDDATILTATSATDQAPVVSITSPADGATFRAGSDIDIAAAASDSDGSVSKVDFYANGVHLGSSDTTSPYTQALVGAQPGTYALTAVATDNQGVTTTSAAVTITVVDTSAGLPSGWRDYDVGSTGALGSATFASGVFTVNGAGADVWGTSDAFTYAETELSGDGSIVARVASVSDQANWVKAGVMIRAGLSDSAAHAFMLVSHAKGVAFQRRTADGGTTVSTPGSASTAPRWVKLDRVGNTIYGSESSDGRHWTLVGSDTFSMPTSVFVGLAVSSHVYGTLATATFDGVTTALPPAWRDADIGSVPLAGSALWDAGTFQVTGSGADIWGTADAFNYAYTLMNGDGTIVARVATVQNVASWVKAGVMIRDSFDPGSAHASVFVSAAKGVAFQRREAAGGTSVSTAGSASAAPHWIKLTRSGDVFTASESADGTTWTQIGSDTIPMATSIYIGLAVTSHSTSASATCTFDHVSVQ